MDLSVGFFFRETWDRPLAVAFVKPKLQLSVAAVRVSLHLDGDNNRAVPTAAEGEPAQSRPGPLRRIHCSQ